MKEQIKSLATKTNCRSLLPGVKILSWLSAAAYFTLVATIAAFTGQHVVRKIIAVLGRTSIIIFILALTIFVSAISLGKSCNFNWRCLISVSGGESKIMNFLIICCRWGGHWKHGWEVGESRIHGIWKSVPPILNSIV